MMDWSIETLIDPRTILTIVSVIISTILGIKLRRRKSLAYETVTESSLIVGEAIKPEVDILFREEKVEDVHLLEVKIINNGNEHVKEEDFKKPITFEFNPDAEIMDMSAEKRSSDSIQISFNLLAQNVVEITPNLLNKKDWFIAKFLLNKYNDFDLSLHAIDIGEIKEYGSPSFQKRLVVFAYTLLFVFFIIALIYYGPRLQQFQFEENPIFVLGSAYFDRLEGTLVIYLMNVGDPYMDCEKKDFEWFLDGRNMGTVDSLECIYGERRYGEYYRKMDMEIVLKLETETDVIQIDAKVGILFRKKQYIQIIYQEENPSIFPKLREIEVK